jgi:Spy/CpxP family protein refolding chaperone
MKPKIITLIAAGGLVLGGLLTVQANDPAGPGHGGRGNPLEHLTKDLNLTADQLAKVQPILDQAKPQIQAIHQEAMDKMKAVMESTSSQIRPLLTAEQQQKLDAIKKAHEDMHNAMKEMHQAKQQ